MASNPTTIFSGTTGPQGDRPGPDRVISRVLFYLVMLLFFPVVVLTYVFWLTIFTYARTPWWVPAPAFGAFLFIHKLTGGDLISSAESALRAWAVALTKVSKSSGALDWFLGNYPHIVASQFAFLLQVGTLFALFALGWKWARRPKWEDRQFRPGPVLWKRRIDNAKKIAAGQDSPTTGITVGIAMDRRDPRFAGGKPGEEYGNRVILKDEEGAGHTLVVGGSGSGKTSTMLVGMRDVIRLGRGLVVIDCKGGPDVPEAVAEWARRYGRDFRHWLIQDPRERYDGPADKPAFYDPVGRGDPSRRKDLLIGSQRWDVEYYKTVIGDYLQTMFTVADMVPPETPKDTFKEISDLLSPRALIERSQPIPTDQYPELTEAIRRIAEMGEQERSGINNMYARLNTLTTSTAGMWLRRDPDGTHDIDLLRVADEGQVVVFSLDTSNYEETSGLIAGLIVQDLKTVSSSLRERPAHAPLHIYIDEFSAVDATNIYGLLSKARDARMPVTLATQVLADLRRREPNFDSQVIGIVSTFLIHRANTEDDARIFAGLSGLAKKMLARLGLEQSSGIAGAMGAASATGAGYLEERETYRVEPGAFQALEQGQCVFIAKMPKDRYVNPVQVILENPAIALSAHDPAVEITPTTRPVVTYDEKPTFKKAPSLGAPQNPSMPPVPPTRPTRPASGTPSGPGRAAGAPLPAMPAPSAVQQPHVRPMTQPIERLEDWNTP